MAGTVLALVNGVPRSGSATGVVIYDQRYAVTGPISAGIPVTLPVSQTYSSNELNIFLNGDRLEATYDYNYTGSIPRTQVTFTFGLVSGDAVDFRIG